MATTENILTVRVRRDAEPTDEGHSFHIPIEGKPYNVRVTVGTENGIKVVTVWVNQDDDTRKARIISDEEYRFLVEAGVSEHRALKAIRTGYTDSRAAQVNTAFAQDTD